MNKTIHQRITNTNNKYSFDTSKAPAMLVSPKDTPNFKLNHMLHGIDFDNDNLHELLLKNDNNIKNKTL